jgi:hypothetical protein
MNFSGGIILVGAAIAMIFFGRARRGEVLPIFGKVWIVGQLYVMAAMTIFVFGIADLIINWPF